MKQTIVKIFETDMSLEDMQKMNEMYATDFKKQTLVRNLQILKDSMVLCLSSKNFDVAFSRFNLMNEAFENIFEVKHLLTEDELIYIQNKFKIANGLFHTNVYINASLGSQKKGLKMKSKKGQLKYLNIAIEFLEKGLEDVNSNKATINSMLLTLEKRKKLLLVDKKVA